MCYVAAYLRNIGPEQPGVDYTGWIFRQSRRRRWFGKGSERSLPQTAITPRKGRFRVHASLAGPHCFLQFLLSCACTDFPRYTDVILQYLPAVPIAEHEFWQPQKSKWRVIALVMRHSAGVYECCSSSAFNDDPRSTYHARLSRMSSSGKKCDQKCYRRELNETTSEATAETK